MKGGDPIISELSVKQRDLPYVEKLGFHLDKDTTSIPR